jgi:hypothetical protein
MILACGILVLTPVLVVVACQSRPAPTLEAQRFILRDKSGTVRAEIAMTYDFGPKGNPFIRLLDENSKELTTIGAGVLTISGNASHAVLLNDQLQFDAAGAAMARMGALQNSGNLWLFGKGGTILVDSSLPSVGVTDSNDFEAVLGTSHLVTPDTGQTETLSAASLVLSGKNGKILWSTPR